MAEYDNTNRCAFFDSNNFTSAMTGRVNIHGTDYNAALVQKTTNSGKSVVEVYIKVGALFPVKSQNEKAPAFSGPIELEGVEFNQIAVWNSTSAKGDDYLSGGLSVRDEQDTPQQAPARSPLLGGKPSRPARATLNMDDDIPFAPDR